MGLDTSPRYQRQIARIQAMSPRQRAILNTVQADEYFASADMKRRLQGMELAARKKARADSMDLQRERFALDKDSAAKNLEQGQKRLDLQGGDLALRQGRLDRSLDLAESGLDFSRQRLDLAAQGQGLARDRFNADQDDLSSAEALGWADVATSVPLGIMQYRADMRQTSALDDFMKDLDARTQAMKRRRY